MADPLALTVTGLEEAMASAGVAVARLQAEAVIALVDEAEQIMTRSKENYVPVDHGILRASGTVRQIGTGPDTTVELQYGGAAAPYALAVHENPRAGKTGGVTPSGHQRDTWSTVGQWKYLEQPFLEAAAGLLERLAARIRTRTGIP